MIFFFILTTWISTIPIPQKTTIPLGYFMFSVFTHCPFVSRNILISTKSNTEQLFSNMKSKNLSLAWNRNRMDLQKKYSCKRTTSSWFQEYLLCIHAVIIHYTPWSANWFMPTFVPYFTKWTLLMHAIRLNHSFR